MGLKNFIGKVLSFLNSEVVIDLGGGNNVSGDNYTPVGDDSQPLPDDRAVVVSVIGTGAVVVAGYKDIKNTPVSNAGEKRIYARDASGNSAVELYLKNDGSAVLSNSVGTVELKNTGDVEANGATVDITGDVKTPEGVSLRLHTHTSAAPGSPTGPPIPTP